jgi:magnesium transporter
MSPHFVRIRPNWTVAYALDHFRRYGMDSETMSMIYVIDEQGKLIDDLRIRQILLAGPETIISDLMDSRFISLKATDDQELAVKALKEADLNALPVTDSEGVLIGIVTADDIFDVAEEEATEDIQKMGGSEALDEPYLEIEIPTMVRKRATWLVVLFLSEMLTATAMGRFEDEIAKAVVLSIFVPLVISSGGNSGSQASTLIIRAMAVGEVKLRDWWRVMRREILSGLALGAILGTVGFLRISLWAALFHSYGEHWLLLALTVGLALIGIVLWGTLSGSMLPFLLRRVGLDPATSSAPFVATLVDVSGLIIYFTVAAIILHGTLL